MGDLFLLHLFIYSIIYLWQYGLMNSYTLGYNPALWFFFFFLIEIVPALAIGNAFRLVQCSFDMPSSFGFTRCSRIILHTPCPSLKISYFLQGAMIHFIGEQYLEKNICVFNVLVATGVSLILGPFSRQLANIILMIKFERKKFRILTTLIFISLNTTKREHSLCLFIGDFLLCEISIFCIVTVFQDVYSLINWV